MYSLLIVDDEKWIRQGLVEAVEWASLGVGTLREAENGEQALKLALEMKPDVVITDIRMSGMGGLSLCEELSEHFPGIQMILISGYRDFSFAQQAIRLGVADYLLKPIDEQVLLSAVRQCLSRMEKLRAQGMTQDTKPVPTNSMAPEMHPAVRAAAQYVRQNYASKLNLSLVARHVHMNSSYLSKLFGDETGETFTHYLCRVRIERAIEMLDDPSMKIYQIAHNVGHTDVKYFVTIFKEITGVTPSEWRQKGAKAEKIAKMNT